MIKTLAKKVPGGKMLKVEVNLEANRLTGVKITGDFFLHPEDTIALFENALKNQDLPLLASPLHDALETIQREQGAQLVGISIDDIVDLVMEATQ